MWAEVRWTATDGSAHTGQTRVAPASTVGTPVTVWTDPEFDPALRAFYYVRVIEIPTPRWTAYDAKYFGIKMPPEVPMTTTERAYTSPIWYTP